MIRRNITRMVSGAVVKPISQLWFYQSGEQAVAASSTVDSASITADNIVITADGAGS